MCAMQMMWKIGTIFLGVAYPHFIFDRIYVCTIRTHISHIIPEYLALSFKQVLSLCNIPLLPPIISGGDMNRNYKSGSTIDPAKQCVIVIHLIIVRVNNCPPPPLCTPCHEPIVCVIYHLFIQIIVEISLDLRRTSDSLVCKPDIEHIHRKNM